MLQKMFYIEITMMESFDVSWAFIAFIGVVFGFMLRLLLKREQDFKDSLTAVIIM